MNNQNAMSVDPLILSSLTPEQQEELTEILDQYLQRIERGESPDADELLTQNPRWSSILRHYLESLGVLHHAARGIRKSDAAETFPPQLAADRTLGDYEIRRQIGRGGMGIVYEARQVSLDRRVALKVLPFAAVLDERQIARFRREAQAAAQLHHPHIVPVFGVGCEKGVHFYSMQLVDGQSLDRILLSIRDNSVSAAQTLSMRRNSTAPAANEESHVNDAADFTSDDLGNDEFLASSSCSTSSISADGSFDSRQYIRRVAELGIQAAKGLQHAHDFGVVHRDIKPSNLMLDREGKLWVTDFGLAHIQSDADNMTATGDLIGTLRYMSPEQAAGSALLDQRTDIYSLGITLYEMLTLQRAINTKERVHLLRDIETLEPKRLRRLNAAVPKDLETIILKSIAKDRDHRYPHAQDFADDLQRFLDGKPTQAKRPTLLDLTTKWASRHRAIVGTCMLMMILALFGTSYSLFRIQQERNRTEAAARRVEERQTQAIQAIEDITVLAKGLSRQPQIKRDIQHVARDLYKQFLTANEEMPFIELAQTHNRIGLMSIELGDFDEALQGYREAAATYRRLADTSRAQPVEAAANLNDLGYALGRSGKSDEARVSYAQALDLLAKLDQADETVIRRTALVLGNLGLLSISLGERQLAMTHLKSAIDMRQDIRRNHSNDIDNLIRLASNFHNLSELYIESDLALAAESCEQAILLRKSVVLQRPTDIESRVELALSYNNLGSIGLRQSRLDVALAQYTLAVETGAILIQEAPDLPQLRHDYAISLNNLGKAQAAFGMLRESLASYEVASKQFELLLPQFEHDAVTLARYGGTLHNQAVVHTKEQPPNFSLAAELFEKAIDIQKRSVDVAPRVTQHSVLLQLSERKYAEVITHLHNHRSLGKPNRELADVEERELEHAN